MTEARSIRHTVLSAAGALLFAGACIGAAVSPAQASAPDTATLAGWQRDAGFRLDGVNRPIDVNLRNLAVRNARISVNVATDGRVSDRTLIQSSGNAVLDRRLMEQARTLRFAPLPATLSARTKPMVLDVALVDDAPAAPAADRLAAR